MGKDKSFFEHSSKSYWNIQIKCRTLALGNRITKNQQKEVAIC